MGTHFSKNRGHHSGVLSGHEVMVYTFMSGTQCKPQRRNFARSSRRYSRSSFNLGSKHIPVKNLSRSPSPVSLRWRSCKFRLHEHESCFRLRKLKTGDNATRASLDLGRLVDREERLLDTLSRGVSPGNDLTIGWQNLNLLSHPNETLVPQARQSRVSGENLNYLLSL